jgi:hypothetical protein
MTNKTINEIHRGKKGKLSNKWDSYLVYYDSLFLPIREESISLLEIGVQNGGSLDTWSEYFSKAKQFVGCDINPKCADLKYEDERISIIVGNANATATFQEIIGKCSEYDIIIDDGSHISSDVITSFMNYFPLLKPGGIYVVEDTHTLYMDAYGGGILNEFGAYAFFKKMVDVVSYQFWQKELSISSHLRTFFPLQSTPDFILKGWVDSVEFRNSIITIRKSMAPGHEKVGKDIKGGSSALVETFGGEYSA